MTTKDDMQRIRKQSIAEAKSENLQEQALTAIEQVLQRIECEDFNELSKEDLSKSMSIIYHIAHSCNPYHICFDFHDGWRKEKDKWFGYFKEQYKT